MNGTQEKAGSVDLDRLKAAILIEDLARQLGLDVRGRQARCFNAGGHKNGDRNRSLGFDTKTNRFKCFACGKQGSVIDLYAEVKGTDFKSAVDALADLAGIARNPGSGNIPGPGAKNAHTVAIRATQKEPARLETTGKMTEIYHALKDFCGTLAPEGMGYLTGSTRGLTPETVCRFQIFGINDYQATNKYLSDRFAREDLKQAGLVSDNGNLIFYKHKILIPFLEGGKIVFLQGRKTEAGDGSKYLMLKDRPVPLFNADTLKDLTPGAKVYICEGVFDAMSLAQRGFNAVAILGVNNFKPDLAASFNGLQVVLCMDNDEAGRKATQTIADIFFRAGQGVKQKTLPEGVKDLTDFFLSNTKGGSV